MTGRSAARFVVVSTLLALVALEAASAASPVRLDGDVALALGVPQSELGDQIRDTGIGGHVNLLVGYGNVPLYAGINVGGMIYGSESRREPFSTTIPDVTVKVTNSNNIFYGHFILRVQPPEGRVRPYLDGLIGFKDFYTKTTIENEDGDNEDPIAESKNLDDVAFSYGGGGGLKVRVYTAKIPATGGEGEGEEAANRETRPLGIDLTAGAWYLLGSEAEYLKKGSIRREGGRVTYDITRSNTDMVIAQIGVSLAY